MEVTDAAIQKLKEIGKSAQETNFVRIKIQGGGCSGLMYNLSFDSSISLDDITIEKSEFKIVIDSKSFIYLKGVILDYEDGLNGKGFVFNNPNAKDTCGCGESFSI